MREESGERSGGEGMGEIEGADEMLKRGLRTIMISRIYHYPSLYRIFFFNGILLFA